MKNCKEINELIPFYIENDLTQDMNKAFEKHIAVCSSCQDDLSEMARVIDLCRNIDEVELPLNFKEELHKKLVKAAEEQDRNRKSMLSMKKYMRIFSSVAAGLLLVVFVKGFYDFGVFSPMKPPGSAPKMEITEDTATRMENRAAGNLAMESTEQNLPSADRGDADTFSAPEAFKASASTVRSVNEERRLDTGTPKEQILVKRTNIVVNIEDEENPIEETEKIKSYAFTDLKAPVISGAGLMDAKTSEEETDDIVVIDLKIPNSRYNQFINLLIAGYGQSNLEIGDIITEDVTDKADALGMEFNGLSDEIHEMENDSEAGSLDMLKEKKSSMEAAETEIDRLQLDSEYISISITVRKKTDN